MNRVGAGSPGTADWITAHETLTRLAKRRAALDAEEGGALLAAARARVHEHLGYGSFAEYVERLLGYSPRTTEEKLRTAQALEHLPELAHALREGAVAWSVVRELTRVATPETERAWLEAAAGKRARQVERLVSGRTPGDRPSDPARPEARRHVLRFDVSAETFATFREAVAHLRRQSQDPLDDDSLLLLLAREILQGPSDAGRANYQVELEPEVVEMAKCDAQRLPRAPAGAHVGGAERATQDIPPAVRRRVLRRDHGRCVVPGCTHGTFLDVHHLSLRSEGGTHHEDNLVTLCSAHHRALHRGTLLIEGTPSSGLHFAHAGGTVYGATPRARDVSLRDKVFRALRRLGFTEREAKRALERASAEANRESAGVEDLLRRAIGLATAGLHERRKGGSPP